MPMIVVVGLQWGDEGKGKMTDHLAQNADVVARWNGGANAGHIVWVGDTKFTTHLLPSGLPQGKVCVLGDGMVIDPEELIKEMDDFAAKGKDVSPKQIMISTLANIVLPSHKKLDIARELARGKDAIGTTGRGISPAYQDKESGRGLTAKMMQTPQYFMQKVCDLVELHNEELVKLGSQPLNSSTVASQYQAFAQALSRYIRDTGRYLEHSLKNGKTVLAEGAQGTLLDKTYGTVPYVTRSSTIASSASAGLGVDPKWVTRTVGIAKCFQTRVGGGPMPTELPVDSDSAKRLRSEGMPGEEVGSTTKRKRRVGWLDLPLLRYATDINNLDELVLTKLDVLTGFESVKVCESYNFRGEDTAHLSAGVITNLQDCTPQYQDWLGWGKEDIVNNEYCQEIRGAARTYVQRIERTAGVPVSLVSVGVDRKDVIRFQK